MAPCMKKRYANCMKQFLDHIEAEVSVAIIISREIPQNLLLSITPKMIVAFLNAKAYGTEYPVEEDRPVRCRSNTLFFYKKALSSFMCNANSNWDDVLNRGNPTKARQVNEMIKRVIKHEVRHEGVSSKARRAFDYKEYLELCKLLRRKGFKTESSILDGLRYTRLLAMLNLQWQLMARMDDMINLKFESICTNLLFPFACNVKMRWSKNITEEREAPDQLILGSLEENICPFLTMAMYIETSAEAGELLSSDGHVFGGVKSRHGIRRLFDVLVSDAEFPVLLAGLVGNHSVRKGSATYAMRSGLSRDHTNRRGRWRVRKQVVDAYIDVNLPYPDTLAAHKLCGPKGSCKYTLHRDVDVSDSFLLEKVVPNCRRLLGDQVALPLGLALLWAGFRDKSHRNDETTDLMLQHWLQQKIVSAYEDSYGTVENLNIENPVRRLGLVPQGNGDQVNMIEIDFDGDDDAAAVVGTGSAGGLSSDTVGPLLAHQMTVQRQIEEVKSQVMQQLFEMKTQHHKQYRILTCNIKRIAIQPVVRPSRLIPGATAQGTQADTSGQTTNHNETNLNNEEEKDETPYVGFDEVEHIFPRHPQLYKSPKTLFDLWQEFQFGINGEKAARDFNYHERGKCKSLYSRRKVFWDCVATLVRAGHTSDTAIDKIYAAYGRNTSVTNILLKMIQDRRVGGHPSLRV